MEEIELHTNGGLIIYDKIPVLYERPEIIVRDNKCFLRATSGVFYEKFSYFIPSDQLITEESG